MILLGGQGMEARKCTWSQNEIEVEMQDPQGSRSRWIYIFSWKFDMLPSSRYGGGGPTTQGNLIAFGHDHIDLHKI